MESILRKMNAFEKVLFQFYFAISRYFVDIINLSIAEYRVKEENNTNNENLPKHFAFK